MSSMKLVFFLNRRKDQEPSKHSLVCSCHFGNGQKLEAKCPNIFEEKLFAEQRGPPPKKMRTTESNVQSHSEMKMSIQNHRNLFHPNVDWNTVTENSRIPYTGMNIKKTNDWTRRMRKHIKRNKENLQDKCDEPKTNRKAVTLSYGNETELYKPLSDTVISLYCRHYFKH